MGGDGPWICRGDCPWDVFPTHARGILTGFAREGLRRMGGWEDGHAGWESGWNAMAFVHEGVHVHVSAPHNKISHTQDGRS